MKVIQCWDDGITNDIRLTGILRPRDARVRFNLNLGLHEREQSGDQTARDIKAVFRLALDELAEA